MRKVAVLLFALVGSALIVGGPALAAQKKASAKKTISVKLDGKQEVPAGSPTGSGTARISLDATKGQVCFSLKWSNIQDPTASHIHKGAKGKAGPVVVPLFGNPPALHSGCVKAKKSLIKAIQKKPAAYYVNVHTMDFAGGAIRAQLG